MVDLHPLQEHVCRRYATAELTEVLGVTRSQIEAWQRSGLITPVEYREGTPCFDFRQATAARTVRDLLAAGVPPRRLLSSVRQLRTWLPDATPVGELLTGMIREGRRFMIRTKSGRLADPMGQLAFEFPAEESPLSIPWTSAFIADDLFDEAVRCEQEGRLEDAARGYRQLLMELGPDADICFNLANVLAGLGEIQAAIERLYEALSLDAGFSDAWNNLANLLAVQGRLGDSEDAYWRAIQTDPEYSDAHYGLADVMEQLGKFDEARDHWRAYLRREPTGAWADYALARLAAHQSPAV
jgi:tetratricopeptide (TPR) repeat protein